MGERITDPDEAVASAVVQLEDLDDVDKLRACRDLRDWCMEEIEKLAPHSKKAMDKSLMVGRLVEQGLSRAQAEVEVSGRMSGDRFVVRASGMHGVKDESWTRQDGKAAKGVMEQARMRGWPAVKILYWTEDGWLTDVTRDVETAT